MGLLSNVRFAFQRLRGSGRPCSHLDQVRDAAPTSEVPEWCIELGDTAVHLRTCMMCGRVGCWDSSKNKHVHKHADEAGHPIARSNKPGEYWMWCFADEKLVRGATEA